MRILNDFICDNGHVTERYTDHYIKEIQCSHCDLLAQRQLASPRSKLEGITGAFPTAYDRWATVHEQVAKVAQSKSYYEG